MNDPFFASTRKRKRANAAKNKKPNDGPRSQPKRTQKDEEISGDEKESDVGDLDAEASEPESSEEEIEETAAEKRVRLAKAYLDKIQDDLDESYAEGFDAADLDRDIISERLKQDVDEQEGRLHRRVADTFDYDAAAKTIRRTSRAHKASVTAVAFTENGKFLYTASADCSIIKWDLETLRKLHVFKGGRRGVTDFAGHTDHILCLAVSSDGKYLASGGKDKLIHIWSVPENKLLGTFRQHRDAISSLAFRKGHNQLYSGSFDRTVKVWSVDELAYVETLFGHQDHITQLDTLGRERCVSTGGRDKTSRLWKIVEESQLVFRGGARSKSKGQDDKPLYVEGSLDCIAQVEEGTFITGGDSGVIAMWDIGRKKPTFTFSEAHGISTTETIMGEINQPYWITALASLRYSDVFASGSWDGKVRLWKIAGDNKSFAPLAEFEVEGVVNSLQFKTASNNRTFLVIGVGQELRYGRWLSLKKIRNEALFVLATSALALAKEYQTPFSAQHLAEEELLSATEQWLHTDSIQKSCSSCISLMQIVKNLSFMSEAFLIATLTNVCQRTQKVDKEVCAGVIREQAPILRKVLKTMEVSGRDGHLLCAAVLNSCPYPEVEPWRVPFPKPKPSHVPKRKSSGRTFSVLQLSDWHVDPMYEAGSEALCDKPICCRAEYTDFANITQPASVWGAYSCDSPLSLIESLLEFIPTVAPEISFGILTGDVPPHEVWSTLPTIKTQLIQDESYRLLHSHFDSPEFINTLLYPAVGNHESAPTNIFPLKTSKIPIEEKRHYLHLEWLYKSLSMSWRGWLTRDMTSDVEHNSASYVARPVNGLKLISVNTNFCYNMNWWLYEHPTQRDPNGVLGWLIDQLQDSEDRGERAWIIGHIAPGDSTCFHDYSNYYHQIVERYAHVIAGQFFGHTHKDEFQMFYKDGSDRNAEDAISMAYVSPSITPFLNVNPGFRMYQVDADTFEVIDSMTYVADLDQAHTWVTGPNWHLEYSAREAYNSSVAPLSGYTSPLTPAWWHNVTVAMEEDPAVFDKYWQYRFKSAPVAPECDEECRNRTVCAVRAGRSEERCDFESDVFPGQSVRPNYKPEEHACSGLFLGNSQV